MSRKIFTIILFLTLLAAGCQAVPPVVDTVPSPLATENVPFPIETPSPQVLPTEQAPILDGLDASTISIQESPLGEAHIRLVDEQPYDNTSGPRIYGLPAHIEITFGDRPDQQYFGQNPIVTIIPVEAYRQMWLQQGDPNVDNVFTAIQALISNPPAQSPTSQLPVLPLDAVQAVIDLAAHFKPLDNDQMRGYRFVGRLSQGINPVINANLYYFFMGVSRDNQYMITMMVPVSSSILVNRIEDFPAADNDLLNSDYMLYMDIVRERLNQQPPADFNPSLEVLDALIQSLVWGIK